MFSDVVGSTRFWAADAEAMSASLRIHDQIFRDAFTEFDGYVFSTAGDYVTLLLFCVLATSSFLYLELYTVFAPAAAGKRLVRLRTWLDTHRDQVMVVVLLLLGFWLAGKSIYLLVS